MSDIARAVEGSCKNCKWHESFSWACFNGDSPYVADFTDNDNWCDSWEKEDGVCDSREV